MYGTEWGSVHTLMKMLFWCLYPQFRSNDRNKHTNNTWAHTWFDDSIYIFFFVFEILLNIFAKYNTNKTGHNSYNTTQSIDKTCTKNCGRQLKRRRLQKKRIILLNWKLKRSPRRRPRHWLHRRPSYWQTTMQQWRRSRQPDDPQVSESVGVIKIS